MPRRQFADAATSLADQYGYVHRLTDELARGGQGVVFRTGDPDLAVKLPLGPNGEPERRGNLAARFANIRTLPLPHRIPISLPLATLRDQPGYVMRLLSDMQPFSEFELNGERRDKLMRSKTPAWLNGVRDSQTAATLLHYAQSGSTKARLWALSRVAAILARLHAAGLVYGDISPNNCFVGTGDEPEVWLIDADNVRFEVLEGGNGVYTPRYGAPEIVQGRDHSRPRTDCWAFSVMAFETLSLVHPFVGRKVLEPEGDEGGWDADPFGNAANTDLDEQAYAGYLPFVDDESDDSNTAMSGLPRELVTTSELSTLFQETFCAGRLTPWRRPAATFWAKELTSAHDQSLVCISCRMSFFRQLEECPYCREPRPGHVLARTDNWELVLQVARTSDVQLPHRLFHPFSLALNGRTKYEASVDPVTEAVRHVRGTAALPSGLTFEFVRGSL